ncbi:succinyl-diaminopimelate desuccinylase [Paraglaciecola psychrophila 170]|uniref:Succinyl-diaminopimelate desuccinylase n=1 Tax=Paraglaciecola psychrophila 170 TaxID=1129794 RepID=K7A9S0_9ALTE|nr:succinyl-diaminopimelate desuccinylase [Paraglaciecola psychrophila 170]GAC37478.1 succinyl-diaminopimelate desuccinylase [Paraglaciecola psychrophila 170]
MIKFLVLIPVVLFLIWFMYLKKKGYSLGDGKQGFIYIFTFCAVIAVFYSSLLWITE